MGENEGVVVAKDFGDVSLITPAERDMALGLHKRAWGKELRAPWKRHRDPARHFSRELRVQPDGRPLRDHLVRFPSAPIYGINRRQSYEVKFERPNLHTLRLLKRPGDHGEAVDRVFVLHNGLNESESLRFYYQLGDWLLHECEMQDERAACIIAPFPGHLTHFPFSGPFVESPLSRYLADSGELFRQFLRYMVETKWLLSVVSRAPNEPWMAGRPPLDPGRLVGDLHEEWTSLREASIRVLPASGDGGSGSAGPEVSEAFVGDAVANLEWLMWGYGGPEADISLPVHLVGYSLGGFVAQSIFFSWPNLVASCATICSGGAIKALSPTAFAHSEEWQAVLHSLRPEIEGSMLAGKIVRDQEQIIGMPFEEFGYLQRIFEQVFLAEDQASYKERLSEYGPRMLFVSGGEDPIVKTKDVLDASPAEGITMLSVARMTHFLGLDARTSAEAEQRDFWLPEAGGMVARAAIHAEALRRGELERAEALHAEARSGVEPRGTSRPVRRPASPDLYSPEFEHALDWVIDKVHHDSGWLFVCRNGIPAAFQSAEMGSAVGGALHHHDVQIQEYAAGLARRSRLLKRRQRRLTLCVSDHLEEEFTGGNETFDTHSDTPAGLITAAQRQAEWSAFNSTWRRRVRWFTAGPISEPLATDVTVSDFAARAARWCGLRTADIEITRLPDVWISLGDDLRLRLADGDGDAAAREFVGWVGDILAEQESAKARRGPQRRSKELEGHLENGEVRIVRVSGTELNPRYRGRYERSFARALLLLSHCAAALVRSRPDGGAAVVKR